MPIGNDAHLCQAPAEIARVSGQLLYLIATRIGAILAHYDAHRGVDLLYNGRRDRAGIAMGVAVCAQEVNQFLRKQWELNAMPGNYGVFMITLEPAM